MSKQKKSQAELYLNREKSPYHYWTSEDGLLRVAGWASDGLTTDEIAEKMGTVRRTLNRWRGKSQALKDALANNRDSMDRKVENALVKNALGFSYTETKTVVEVDDDGNKTQKIEKYERYAKPDTVAMIFYLKNRKPDTWRDNQQLDIAATVGLVQIVDDVPKKEIIEGEVVDGTNRITDGSDSA